MAIDSQENGASMVPENVSEVAAPEAANPAANDQATDTTANATTESGNGATQNTPDSQVVDNQTQVVSDVAASSAADTPRDQTGQPASAGTQNQPLKKDHIATPLVKGGKAPTTIEEWKAAYEGRDRSYRASQSEYSKLQARHRQIEEKTKAYEGIEPDTIRAFKEQSEQARLKNLPKHDPSHPEHSKFVGLRSTFTRLWSEVNKESDPVKKEALKSVIQSTFSDPEKEDLRKWQDDIQEFGQDPVTSTRKTAAQVFESMWAYKMKEQAAEREIDQWVSDPGVKPLIDKYEPEMRDAIERGVPKEFATVLARQADAAEKAQARIAELEAKLGIANTTVGVASEKERLLKSSASISRDGATREVATMTIYDEARKLAEQRGIELGDRRFMRILQEVENKRKSA